MPPVEAWQKVYLSGSGAVSFFASPHGKFGCTACHAGTDGNLTKDEAHAGLVARPSADPQGICRSCHPSHAGNAAASLHGTLQGERVLVARRYGVDDFEDLPEGMKEGYARDCAGCHTSCGDCHVSRPVSVGGGLVDGHRFGDPDMTENCTACHGSRVGAEFRGENAGVAADVHYVPGGMRCLACHSGAELHGDGSTPTTRLDAPNQTTCEECHQDVVAANVYHDTHWGELQCQVCHSADYKSCNSCHAGAGLATPSYMSFKVGRNPMPQYRSPQYVVLRHIPIAEDTYRGWGTLTLDQYGVEPTWRYAAPHNIQRWTDRTRVAEGAACSIACHGSPDGTDGIFLRQADLDAMSPAEAAANDDLIVPDGSPDTW